jgi:hypothetical protein
MKVYDPRVLWDAIHSKKACGEDFFILILEELYSRRFSSSYDQMFSQVEKIKQESIYQIEKISKVSCEEIKELKRLLIEKDLIIAELRENHNSAF